MHLFIPYFDATSAENALHEARLIARPGDRVFVMATVVVPNDLPVDVGAGEIWKRVCKAERQLFHAREVAERILPGGVALRFVRVQARDQVAAIRAGVAHYGADLLLFDVPRGLRGTLALRFGTLAAVLRDAPCNVRFVGTATAEEPALPTTEPVIVAPFTLLRTIAVNPSLAASGAADRAQKTEGQHAS